MVNLVKKGIDIHRKFREEYEDADKEYISGEVKGESTFVEAQQRLTTQFTKVMENLNEISTPHFFPNHFGHMAWDCTIPSIAGNVTAMLYNQNNVTYESSPFTLPL